MKMNEFDKMRYAYTACLFCGRTVKARYIGSPHYNLNTLYFYGECEVCTTEIRFDINDSRYGRMAKFCANN